MKIRLKYLFLPCMTMLMVLSAVSQVTISGPDCVVAGTVYQYTISGKWDSASTMQVCISSSTIAGSMSTSSCTVKGAPLAAVLVVWNDSASDTGNLSLTSSKGNAKLSVNFTKPLIPGSIGSAGQAQVIAADSMPSSIHCSLDAGGSCNPSYSYQWQQSPDAVSWRDIAGSNALNLSFSSVLSQTTFFRRKVTETGSGTIGYSNVAVVTLKYINH
jgi:hypothetical protein